MLIFVAIIGCLFLVNAFYRYERMLNEMLSHLERQPRNKDRRVAWLQHIEPLFSSVGLVLLAHFRRIFPLFFQWMRADDEETVILVGKHLNKEIWMKVLAFYFKLHINSRAAVHRMLDIILNQMSMLLYKY